MRRRPWRLIIPIFLFISGCVSIVPLRAEHGDKIRVLVSRGAKELNITGAEAGSLHIKRNAYGEVTINGKEISLPLRIYPGDELIYLNGRPYRGVLEVMEAKDGLLVVDELFLEAYLVGIINNEISSKWPEEAVKAQAVIARTYALYQKNKKSDGTYHIEGTVMGQVYNGTVTEDPSALRAVRETSGEVLQYSGEPALTVYHSNAGGMTDSSKDIWARYYPYLNSVKSPYDSTAPKFLWEFSISAGSLKTLLNNSGYRIGEPEEVVCEGTTPAGRVKALVIRDSENRGLKLTGEDLRKIVGYSNLRSTIFEVRGSGRLFTFKGKGSGHGVGLSQWGAKGMAENGYSYREILEHFYPGTELVKAY